MIEYNAIFLNTAIIMRAKKSILIKMHLPCILFTRRVEKTALRCFRLATLVCDLETLFRLAHRHQLGSPCISFRSNGCSFPTVHCLISRKSYFVFEMA